MRTLQALAFAATPLLASFNTIDSQSVQRGSATQTASASQVVSAVAVATWFIQSRADGSQELALLVVWRGAPGWFMNGARSSSMGTGGSRGGPNMSAVGATLQYGSIELSVHADLQKRVASVAGFDVVLGNSNTVLVDNVDQKPSVVGTQLVEPTFATANGPTLFSVGRSAEVAKFVRCDALLPQSAAQFMIERACEAFVH